MINRHQKASNEQQAETARQQAAAQGPKEFAGADEMLRFDSAQTEVPPGIAQKLQKSVASENANRSWWTRLFRR